MTNEVKINKSGYPVKECPQCKQDINIHSFVNELCYSCHDNTIVKVWEITEGDYNDVFSKKTVKGTANEVEDYCLNSFDEYDKDRVEDLGTDSIGYCVYYPLQINPKTKEPYEDQEIRIEYYIEAIELEHYNENEIDFELNKEYD